MDPRNGVELEDRKEAKRLEKAIPLSKTPMGIHPHSAGNGRLDSQAADGGVVEVQGVWRAVLPQKKRVAAQSFLEAKRALFGVGFRGNPKQDDRFGGPHMFGRGIPMESVPMVCLLSLRDVSGFCTGSLSPGFREEIPRLARQQEAGPQATRKPTK